MPWGWALVVVACGGAVGAVLRHLLAVGLGSLPGVLLANVVGAGALGGLLGAADRLPAWVVLGVGTGAAGALTTWSTLAVLTWQVGRRHPWRAAAYLLLSVGLGVAAAGAAYVVV